MLVVSILVIGSCGEALAKSGKRHLRTRHVVTSGRQSPTRTQLVSKQPMRLGPMRYYGGPKSPMWRAPVEN
jgi:hypothetical protein